MPKAEKVERVSDLKERIDASSGILLTEYRGLTVAEISELRRSLAGEGTQFAVVKNTLMRRAAAEAGMDSLEQLLEGPSAVAFVTGDIVAAAKTMSEALKQYPALVLKGGFLDGKVLTAEEAKALADLESREVMLSKIAGLIKSDITRAASMFVATQSKFLALLEAFKEKVPADGAEQDAAPAVAEAAPAEAGEETAPADEATAEVEATESEAPAAEAPVEAETEAPADEATAEAPEAQASDEGSEASGEEPAGSTEE